MPLITFSTIIFALFGFGPPISRYFYACYEWLAVYLFIQNVVMERGRKKGRKGALRLSSKIFNLMLGIFILSAISEDSAKEEGGFN
jgi:hypothetical protein